MLELRSPCTTLFFATSPSTATPTLPQHFWNKRFLSDFGATSLCRQANSDASSAKSSRILPNSGTTSSILGRIWPAKKWEFLKQQAPMGSP